MRTFRVLCAVFGVAAGVWGAWLAIPIVLDSVPEAVSMLTWLGGGPVLHDALAAPVVGLVGLVVSRWAPTAWRAPLFCGLAITGVVLVLAVPSVWRAYAYAGPANVGLHDRNYPLGIAVTLGVVWLLVGITGVIRTKTGPRSTG